MDDGRPGRSDEGRKRAVVWLARRHGGGTMRWVRGRIAALVLGIGVGLAAGTPSASAQDSGGSGSLGGYGATAGFSAAGMASRSPMIIPYGGRFEGFMPGRMGG